MMDELSLLDATAQAELIRTGQVTAAELVEAAIERIEALNPSGCSPPRTPSGSAAPSPASS